MSILTMLWKNLWGGNRTTMYPASPSVAKGYRGVVEFDPELCTGCAICKFRCTSRAIEFKGGKGEFTWSYDGGQCTFCGRCVEGCKAHALHQDEATPPIYLHLGDLKNSYTVARKAPAPRPAAPAATATPAAATPAAAVPAATPQSPDPATGGTQ